MADSTRVGFVGLGNIGGAVAANLVGDGHATTVFDLVPERVAAVAAAGARPAASVAEVAADSDVTFLSLPTPAAMAAVSGEWLAAAPDGGLLVDLTTNSPSVVRAVGRDVAAAGKALVEAPLTGGAVGARNRTLVFIVGGDPADVERVRPLLGTIGRASFHLGPLGCGSVGKLVNSLMAFSATWASMEGLALGARHGIDLRTLVDVVKTAGPSNFYLDRGVEGINDRGARTEFALELAAKDAGLILEVGRDASVPTPIASAVHQVLVTAKSLGLGDHDWTDLAEVMERVAGVELRLAPPG
jgi:3-hydroxyisobutyrate dehydrogenase